MNQTPKISSGLLRQARWISVLRHTVGGFALAGIVGSGSGSAVQGAPPPRPPASPAPRSLAVPVKFSDVVRRLDDPNHQVRLEAIQYLETLNRPATDTVPPLMRRFNDPDLRVRVHAVRVAIRAGLPVQQGVPVAAQCLAPDYPDVCCVAAQILADAGPAAQSALPKLRECQTAPSPWVRLYAARAALAIDPTDTTALNTLRSALADEPADAKDFADGVLRESLNGLTEQLADADPAVRRSAVLRLEQLGSAASVATPALVGRLADPDLDVRVHAARAALRAGTPAEQIVAVVSELLVPERLDVLRMATLILVEIGPDARAALPQLRQCLEAPSIAVQLHAAEAALRIDPGEPAALQVLQAALEQPHADVRYFAVNALGAAVMDSDGAVFAVHCALTDPHPKVATAAALQLSRTHDLARRPAAGDQVTLAEGTRPMPFDVTPWVTTLSDTSAAMRGAAAIRLAIAGPAARKAVPALMEHLGDSDPLVRLHVAQAMWDIDRNGYAILPVLVDLLLTNHGGTRIGALYTLGRMGPSAADAAPWVAQGLNGNKSFDRLLMAEAALRIDPTHKDALEILVRGLHHSSADVRYLSTVALGGAPLERQFTVEQALIAAIDDRNSRVRSAAYETLSQLQVRKCALPLDNAGPNMLATREPPE